MRAQIPRTAATGEPQPRHPARQSQSEPTGWLRLSAQLLETSISPSSLRQCLHRQSWWQHYHNHYY